MKAPIDSMSPAISVIIPVYKVERWLPRCLDSLLAQTCPDWEAICVDDGSPDQCGALLDAYAAKDARFRVIHKEAVKNMSEAEQEAVPTPAP